MATRGVGRGPTLRPMTAAYRRARTGAYDYELARPRIGSARPLGLPRREPLFAACNIFYYLDRPITCDVIGGAMGLER